MAVSQPSQRSKGQKTHLELDVSVGKLDAVALDDTLDARGAVAEDFELSPALFFNFFNTKLDQGRRRCNLGQICGFT